jgi:nucleoside-diphosphate-sugar epimerase
VDTTSQALPDAFASEAELLEFMTRPTSRLCDVIRSVEDPLVILGAGGKMGPSLAVLARRAAAAVGRDLRIIAVSRFTDVAVREELHRQGVETHAADLLDPAAFAGLPDSWNLVYLVGLKFGTSRDPAATWAANTLIPAQVARRYPGSRIVVLSTGNVYPMGLVGSREEDALVPLGEYANAAVARERVFEFVARREGLRLAVLRLSYAVEMRYGVLVDIARRLQTGLPVDLAVPRVNFLWQGDANEMILRALELCSAPPCVVNLTGTRHWPVRELATRLAAQLGVTARFLEGEGDVSLLSDTTRMRDLLGEPALSVEALLHWTAGWLRAGGRVYEKPTRFEVRDGRY